MFIDSDFEKVVKNCTREEFENNYFVYGDIMSEDTLYCKNDDTIEISCPVTCGCIPKSNGDCKICWEIAIKEVKFKGEK